MMYFILDLLKNDFFVWFTIITTVVYFILTKNHGYWASRNVKYIRPLPLFGNSFSSVLSISPSSKVQQEQYNYFKGQRYGGIWGFWKPKLLILDPELIEHIIIKDFSYFTDREGTAESKDPLTRNLVNQNGKDWKILRTKLTPVFSSGKLKTMIQQITECSAASVEHLAKKAADGKPLEVREEMAAFTMDVIGSCAFGLNLNVINEPDSKFKKLGQLMFAPSRKMKLRRSLAQYFGFIFRMFRWRPIPGPFGALFGGTVMRIIKYREENNFHRNDFIQLMMEVRKEEEKQLKEGTISKIVMDDNTILANAFVFLLAGYETTATTLGYVLYELSTNPKIQEKVYKEVEGVLKNHKGEMTWEALNEMKYVEMVITETLRKHPPVIDVSRQSVKPYKIPNSDLELPKGSVIIVPTYSIHHDPKYYPNPERFEPERFSEENKHKLVKNTYMPFGDGPRICIGQPYGGILSFWKPKLLILDLELIEHVMVKDFSYFMDREGTADVDTDPLARHLVNQNGNNWKILRTKLTPVFSSGKLKTMIQQILECSNACVEQIVQKAALGKPLEVREEMSSFTMDVIGSCAFGLNLNVMNDPNSKFKKLGQLMFAPSRMTKIRRVFSAHFGFLLRIFRWKRMPGAFATFFVNTVMGIVKYREENNFHRNDFIQLMMEVRKEEEKQLKDGTISKIVMDDNTITSNAFVFLLAGFETTATTLSYILYELSSNPEIQEKVYNEVESVLNKYKGEITWEGLNEMKYVEMVITETLRKHPPIPAVARQSVKHYKFPNSDLELPQGSIVVIPIYSIHHDPKYYPEPEKFVPERFSEENKHKLVKSTYLPFGDGPRICIGLRFARMEIKIAISKLIMRYKFSLNSKTLTPLQYSPKTIFMVPIGGIWVDFIPRTN